MSNEWDTGGRQFHVISPFLSEHLFFMQAFIKKLTTICHGFYSVNVSHNFSCFGLEIQNVGGAFNVFLLFNDSLVLKVKPVLL